MSKPTAPQQRTALRQAMDELGLSMRRMAADTGLPLGAISRLANRHVWPGRGRVDDIRRSVGDSLRAAGLSRQRTAAVLAAIGSEAAQPAERCKPVAPAATHDPSQSDAAAADPPADQTTSPTTDTRKEHDMLLRKETLSPEAIKHFGLPRTLFGLDDIQVREDVMLTAQMRYVRAALMDAAQHNGFVAISGESGAGKTTLREEMEERIREERLPIIVIKPWPHGMEPTEARGTPLRAGHIAEAIVHALAPGVGMKSSPQARLTQIYELLKSSRAAGYRHLLMIEEAHRMPTPTLKHLKNFLEMKDGLRRLMGIALIGQTELQTLLSDRNPEVREIVQRCEQIALEPLDNDLEAYLRHKFERAGLAMDQLLGDDAVDAIRARLMAVPRGGTSKDAVSICYPQVVNNLLCRALNGAARVSWPRVDAQVVAGV